MKKIMIILAAALISGNMFSQKVKIEKKTNLMSIDNIDVARFSSSKNSDGQETYLFTDLKSDDFVKLTMVKLGKDETNFLQVVSSLSDKTSEMDYEIVNFTLNMSSVISNLIVKKYSFFTTAGMNKGAIVEFLNIENKNYQLAHEAKVREQQDVQGKMSAFAPSVKNALTVVNKNSGKVIITLEDPTGKYDRYKDLSTDYENFVIKDSEGNILGAVKKIQSSDVFPDYSIETYDKETYLLGKVTPSTIPMEVTKKLIYNDYLGDGEKSPTRLKQLRASARAARAADEQVQAEEYNRRVNVNGILTLVNGTVLKGPFMVDFRETPEGMVSQSGTIISLDGKTLTHYYKDEKGKDKAKIYKEKEIRSFQVIKEDDPDYDEYYCTIEYISLPEKSEVVTADGALSVIGLGKNLLGNKPKNKKGLVYRAVDMPKTILYFSGNKIFVQDKKKEKTVELSKSEYENQLKEIALDCPVVIENINKHQYQLNRNSIYDFTKDYNECK